MRNRLAFLVGTALVLAASGCGKKQAPPPAQPTAAAAEPAQSQPLVGEVDRFMTEQLQIFIQQKGRLPADFAEFARVRLDSVPRTPPGTKYAIDPVTREVKIVKR